MKPEELMIGDVLEYMGTIVKVYSIGAKICVKECFGKNTYIVNFDNLLKGLELTPEILKKNGFEECRIEEIANDPETVHCVNSKECETFDFPGYENVIVHKGNTKGGKK